MDRASVEATLLDLSGRSDLRLPPYPAVLARIARLLARDDYTAAELAGTVRTDGAVTAAILRFASSARYSAGPPVVSLERAVKLIGAREVMRSVIATSLGVVATAPGPLMALRYKVWRQALLAALLTQELAPGRRLQPEAAYLAGLLHDFGKIVLCGALETTAATAPALPEKDWDELIEQLHVNAGARAARAWRLPPDVIDVIRAHHGDAPRDEGNRPLVALIQHVDDIVELADRSPVLSAELLAAVPGLTAREHTRIAAVFPALVEAVASFADPTPEPRVPLVTWVAPAGEAPAPGSPVGFGVRCDRHGGAMTFVARTVDWQALNVTGKHALAEHSLVKVALELRDREIGVWMTVASCVADGNGFAIELRPFALHGDTKTAYYEMVMRSVRASRALPPVTITGRG